jgi:hypothetical protein
MKGKSMRLEGRLPDKGNDKNGCRLGKIRIGTMTSSIEEGQRKMCGESCGESWSPRKSLNGREGPRGSRNSNVGTNDGRETAYQLEPFVELSDCLCLVLILDWKCGSKGTCGSLCAGGGVKKSIGGRHAGQAR